MWVVLVEVVGYNYVDEDWGLIGRRIFVLVGGLFGFVGCLDFGGDGSNLVFIGVGFWSGIKYVR